MTTTGRHKCDAERCEHCGGNIAHIDDTFTELARKVAREAAMHMRIEDCPRLWGYCEEVINFAESKRPTK